MPTALPWASHAQTLTALYGLPAWSFRDFTFWGMPGETTVYMAIAGSSHPETKDALLNIGWAVLTAPLPDGLPTGALLRTVGGAATRNTLEVDAEGERHFRAGRALHTPPVEAEAAVFVVRRGARALGGVHRGTGLPVD